jgi:anti-anti-sigma factor
MRILAQAWAFGSIPTVTVIPGAPVKISRIGTQLRLQIVDDPLFREFGFSRLVLEQVSEADIDVLLDMALVATLHSPGLANLVSIHVNLQKRGKTLTLTNLNEHNQRLLRATNLDRLLRTV